MEGGIIVVHQLMAVMMEELGDLEGEELDAVLSRVRNFAVFTGPHGKEECTNSQLADCLIEGSVVDGDKLAKNMGSDGFLWLLAGVSVGVTTLQLSL